MQLDPVASGQPGIIAVGAKAEKEREVGTYNLTGRQSLVRMNLECAIVKDLARQIPNSWNGFDVCRSGVLFSDRYLYLHDLYM